MNALPKPPTHYQHQLLTRKQRWWHEALADFLVANPAATNKECSDYFAGARSPDTIALIRNTDVFKALLSGRRQELRENMDAAIVSKLTGITYTAFDAILNRLEKKRDTLPMNELTNVIETVNKFVNGPKPGVSVVVNNQPQTLVVPVGVSDLQEAQAALRRHQSSLSPVTIDVTPNPEPEKEKVEPASPAVDPAP